MNAERLTGGELLLARLRLMEDAYERYSHCADEGEILASVVVDAREALEGLEELSVAVMSDEVHTVRVPGPRGATWKWSRGRIVERLREWVSVLTPREKA